MTTFTENRPTTPAKPVTEHTSVLGHKGLMFEEALLFELHSDGANGVDLPAPPAHKPRLGAVKPRGRIGLVDVSEPAVVRHYTRLSQKNYAIDSGLYPLGSCTMKHNPRLNEKMARLPGLADLHPMQPSSTTQGALQLIDELANWLMTLTGMSAVAMSPAAGAHGEFCGMLAIKAALRDRGEEKTRTKVLVPESAHGTNPATAAALGFSVVPVKAGADGRVTVQAVREALTPEVAAIMLTNPNTCGLFEREIVEIAKAVHDAGGYFYCDGANFNAIVGRVRPADLGVDCMHINLHKTFSTPHGGGGPGSGPVVLSDRLAAYAPVPFVRKSGSSYEIVEHATGTKSFGRLKGFHGQMGMFIRALAYILSHGADGLWQASGDAVLNANYIHASCKDVMSAPYPGPCMHEALFDDSFLKDTGITTLDFAKAMIDEGFHPMTMYFPLVVHGAMLIEPTESESKRSLDGLIAVLRALAKRAKDGDAGHFTGAPRFTPRLRLDETKAARQPVLKWQEQK
jgi:glycine dehydrogenase subunit 2